MELCLFGITALEALRASSTRTPGPLTLPKTAQLGRCGVPHLDEAREALGALGLSLTEPLHVLVESDAHSHTTTGIVRHIAAALPPRSLIRLSEQVLVPCPELCFIQLASQPELLRAAQLGTPCTPPHERQQAHPDPLLSEVDLALIGFELCGTYAIAPGAPGGFSNTPDSLTSTAALGRFLARASRMRGLPTARDAACQVLDGAHSPAEAALALLLCGSRRIGGMGLRGGVCNYRLETPGGPRFVDLAFPERDAGLEYQGEAYHQLDRTQRDDRRQNALAGEGMTILNVWKDDLAQRALFDKLLRELARLMGVRLRIRSADFPRRQALLRARVLPPLQRYDDILF